MPPGKHFDRAAVHQCRWHTGCGKRFSSKRQLHRHLEEEHGLRRDAERGWRATGFGARLRRQNQRALLPKTPRTLQERGVIAMLNQTPYEPHIASRVSFAAGPAEVLSASSSTGQCSRGSATAEKPPPAGGTQPSCGIGRRAAIGSAPAGSTVERPPLSPAPAAMPPFGRHGGSTSAERPPASSADMPPSNTCVEGASSAVAFGVSPGPVPDRPPAGPRFDIDDDLWVPPGNRWNVWMREIGVDAANVRL